MTWKVTIIDRIDWKENPKLQYPAIIHNDHCIDLTGANWSTGRDMAYFDDDGDPIYCRRCDKRVPDHIMVAYKGLIEMMRAGDPDRTYDTGTRHFFRRPTTNG